MTTKEYLQQAYRIDQRINSKLSQVASLRELACKATATLHDTPPGGGNKQSMENAIVKMLDLENEINQDIDKLIDIKREITAAIKHVSPPEYQTLLELRYLCFKPWEQIAVDMGYSLQNIFRIHKDALNNIKRIE